MCYLIDRSGGPLPWGSKDTRAPLLAYGKDSNVAAVSSPELRSKPHPVSPTGSVVFAGSIAKSLLKTAPRGLNSYVNASVHPSGVSIAFVTAWKPSPTDESAQVI